MSGGTEQCRTSAPDHGVEPRMDFAHVRKKDAVEGILALVQHVECTLGVVAELWGDINCRAFTHTRSYQFERAWWHTSQHIHRASGVDEYRFVVCRPLLGVPLNAG